MTQRLEPEQPRLRSSGPAEAGDGAPVYPSADAKTAVDGPVSDPLCGVVIDGRYRIERQIGAGGMSRVYLGWSVKTGVPLAIKILERSGDSTLRQRSIGEARAMMQLSSNHVVHALDVGEISSGQLYIVMEYLDGQTLESVLQREGPIWWVRVANMGIQICNGLTAAHRQKIVHRDIKPQNCVLMEVDSDPEHVKIIDFGIARDLTAEIALTKQGYLVGTPEYLAPEIIRGDTRANESTDIYALGVTLFKLLTGRVPFQGANTLAVLDQHLEAPPLLPSQVARGMKIPEEVDGIVTRALAKDPATRFSSAEELALALQAALGRQLAGRPASARTVATSEVRKLQPIAPAPVGLPPPRQRRPVIWRIQYQRLAAVLSMGLCFLAGTLLVRPSDGQPASEPAPTPDPPADDPRQPPPESPASPDAPEPTFPYERAKQLVDAQQGYLRSTCLTNAGAPAAHLKFRVDVKANGRPEVRVYAPDPAVRTCIRETFASFMFDESPRGGAFEYQLSNIEGTLRPLSMDGDIEE